MPISIGGQNIVHFTLLCVGFCFLGSSGFTGKEYSPQTQSSQSSENFLIKNSFTPRPPRLRGAIFNRLGSHFTP